MRGIILDTLEESSGTCYLVKVKLGDYICAVPDNYKKYDVQREIVKNVYLDNLIQTVFQKKHIPPIVLVAEKSKFNVEEINFEMNNDFKILDGLQRTFRLKAIYDTIQLLKEQVEISQEIFELSKIQISRKYKDELERINSSTMSLNRSIEFLNEKSREISILNEIFDRDQWFEIWTGLTPEEEISKMLVLNAGHKPVKTKHQLELLFLNVIDILKDAQFEKLKVIREKDVSSAIYSKNRRTGEFHFSHLITALLSFAKGSPLTTNVDLVQKKQSDYFDDEIFDNYMQYPFLREFVAVLLEIDETLVKEYGGDGTKWMGRETSLVGLFAAAGKFAQEMETTASSALQKLNEKVCAKPAILNLKGFEQERNSVDLAKVNIGTINKKAVYNGVYDILIGKGELLDWKTYFKGSNHHD